MVRKIITFALTLTLIFTSTTSVLAKTISEAFTGQIWNEVTGETTYYDSKIKFDSLIINYIG